MYLRQKAETTKKTANKIKVVLETAGLQQAFVLIIFFLETDFLAGI